MEQTASTTTARESTVIDYTNPCRRCGSLAGREYDDRYECTQCGNVLPKPDSNTVQTTFTHSDTDETFGATQDDVERAVEALERTRR